MILFILSKLNNLINNSEIEADINKIYEFFLQSNLSDSILHLRLPYCFYANNRKTSLPANGALFSSIQLEFPRLAFSENSLDDMYECPDLETSYSVEINPVHHFSETESLDKYWIDFQVKAGAKLIASKNGILLYKTSPVENSIFLEKNFPQKKRPISIDFIAYDHQTPNSSFRYFFNIPTFIHNEFELKYTVIATDSDSTQFAEQFHQVIEKNQSILDYPEIIEAFVINNENVARYFEQHSFITSHKGG